MMGCQSQSSSHHPSNPDACYSQASSHALLQETVSVSHSLESHLQYPVHSPSLASPTGVSNQDSGNLTFHIPSKTESSVLTTYHPLSSESPDSGSGCHSQSQRNTLVQQQQFACHTGNNTYCNQAPRVLGSSQFAWEADTTTSEHPTPAEHQHLVSAGQVCGLSGQQFVKSVKKEVSLYKCDSDIQQHFRCQETLSQKQTVSQQQQLISPVDTVKSQPFSELAKPNHPVFSRSSATSSLHPPPSFTSRSIDYSLSATADREAPYTHFSQQSQSLSGVQSSLQQTSPTVLQQYRQQDNTSPLLQLPSPTSFSAMLDKKPTLQVVTTDHSPISPGSTASSPRFIFPDMQASSSSGHLGSDSGSSPFMSPVKREIKLEVGTPPQSCELDPAIPQDQRERRRVLSGDTDPSDTVVDSETGSSVLEDSSSSREQSPFSAMAESLSLHSPSENSSPLTKKSFPHHMCTAPEDEEDHGDEDRGCVQLSSVSQPDSDFHPSKFKKRLHERYVLSMKDMLGSPCKIKQEVAERGEGSEVETHSDSKRPLTKLERSDSPLHADSPMPKSPRRSSSDTEMVHTESAEMGASSADEGDVFMEPTMRVRTKHKPPSLHQKEPLDLSRGPFYPGFRSSSSSSPLIDPEHLSPASKIFSPVFRSPHRLPYSPHGLMSPQSQSPLCSVPEGGRIFNFNMPSPLEGPHSDSDLISPSPMSPRIFTFPPQGPVLNPVSEVNRLAVSPRAPYTPPPSFMRSKHAGGVLDSKWGDQQNFYSKRSLSESDMTYLCPICGQVFPTNDNLAKHMTKHLPTETVRASDNNKVHYCKVCNRSFSRSDMLTRHMRLHTGLKPYECMECGQVFSRSDHLNTHRRTHTGEKPYRCPHCPYAACRRDMITRHMRTHAKRTSRRARYLSVPDDVDQHKPSGSISSTDTIDSQDYSTGVHTCSVSSVDSVELESMHSSHPSYLGASVDSLLSPGPHSSPSSRKPSEELDEVMEGEVIRERGSHFDRFMHYRKARNWSTTSLESVDSEEALLAREVLVDDTFHDADSRPLGPVREGNGKDISHGGKSAPTNPKDVVSLEAKTLQKCFISSHPPGSSSSSSS